MNPSHTAVNATTLPLDSLAARALPGAYFADCYEVPDPRPEAAPLQAWLDLVARTPRWTRGLMAWRNQLVRLAGLKDLGGLGDLDAEATQRPVADFRVGQRVGIFEIRQIAPHELVLGQDDHHLDVQVALHKLQRPAADGRPQAWVAVSTVVHVHNRLGRAYMAVVTPFHRLIARDLLARLASAPQPSRHGQR